MMNCIIIEDQPPAQRILKKYIKDIEYLNLSAVFSNALDAMTFLKEEKIDLIFLDIHLPKISGIDFLKSTNPDAHIILTTAFSDYALESYEYNVVDYLLKPFSFQRFIKAVSKIPNTLQPADENLINEKRIPIQGAIFVKSGYEHIKIVIEQILYIKSEADYTEVFLPTKKHLTTNSLRYWLTKLDAYQFYQIHKSYVINTQKVIRISATNITLTNGDIIPIGRSFKEAITKKLLG